MPEFAVLVYIFDLQGVQSGRLWAIPGRSRAREAHMVYEPIWFMIMHASLWFHHVSQKPSA
jgi:hypothetical protein